MQTSDVTNGASELEDQDLSTEAAPRRRVLVSESCSEAELTNDTPSAGTGSHPDSNGTPTTAMREFALHDVKELQQLALARASGQDVPDLDQSTTRLLGAISLLDHSVYAQVLQACEQCGWDDTQHQWAASHQLQDLHRSLASIAKEMKEAGVSPGPGRFPVKQYKALLKSLQHGPLDLLATAATATRTAAPPRRKGAEQKLQLLSITVTMQCTTELGDDDLPLPVFNMLLPWMQQRCMAGAFGYERGPLEGKLHGQGVVKIKATNAASVSKELKEHLQAANSNVDVKTRVLTGKGVHTWLGMLGYVQKDSSHAHFRLLTHNVSEEDLAKGREEHVVHGAGPLKKKKELGPFNISTQMMNYMAFRMPSVRIGPARVLLDMLRSGMYYPSAQWANLGAGKGLELETMNAIWKAMRSPELLTRDDVYQIFFSTNPLGRYYTGIDTAEDAAFPDDEAYDHGTLPDQVQRQVDAQRKSALTPCLAVYGDDGFAEPDPPAVYLEARLAAADIREEVRHDLHHVTTRSNNAATTS